MLVTGAARRIGRAIALGFARAGFDVAVHCRASQRARPRAAVAELARARAPRPWRCAADLADRSAGARLVPGRASRRFGAARRASSTTPRASSTTPRPTSATRLLELTAINLAAPLPLARALHAAVPDAAATTRRERGVVINLLDQKLWNLNPDYFSYTLSKAALRARPSRSRRRSRRSCASCGVAPGVTLISAGQTRGEFAAAHRVTPLGRSSTPDDIAAAARFLVECAGVTGTTLLVDGGQHLVPQPRDVLFLIGDQS